MSVKGWAGVITIQRAVLVIADEKPASPDWALREAVPYSYCGLAEAELRPLTPMPSVPEVGLARLGEPGKSLR